MLLHSGCKNKDVQFLQKPCVNGNEPKECVFEGILSRKLHMNEGPYHGYVHGSLAQISEQTIHHNLDNCMDAGLHEIWNDEFQKITIEKFN